MSMGDIWRSKQSCSQEGVALFVSYTPTTRLLLCESCTNRLSGYTIAPLSTGEPNSGKNYGGIQSCVFFSSDIQRFVKIRLSFSVGLSDTDLFFRSTHISER